MNDEVTQIIYCGHIFSKNSIRQWFQHNVRCPVCRYDIRDFGIPTNNNDTLLDEARDEAIHL